MNHDRAFPPGAMGHAWGHEAPLVLHLYASLGTTTIVSSSLLRPLLLPSIPLELPLQIIEVTLLTPPPLLVLVVSPRLSSQRERRCAPPTVARIGGCTRVRRPTHAPSFPPRIARLAFERRARRRRRVPRHRIVEAQYGFDTFARWHPPLPRRRRPVRRQRSFRHFSSSSSSRRRRRRRRRRIVRCASRPLRATAPAIRPDAILVASNIRHDSVRRRPLERLPHQLR